MNSQANAAEGNDGFDFSNIPDDGQRSSFHLNQRVLLGGFLVCLGYYLGAKLGIALKLPPRPVSVMWPPNSILLAALLLAPVRHWWFLLACALPAHLLAQMQGKTPVPMMLCWALSNATEALIGAGLIRWMVRGRFQLNGLKNVVLFLVCGAFLGPFLSSFLDSAFVRLNDFGTGAYWEIWKIRFFSNVLASVTVAPMIVLWARADFGNVRKANWKRWVEGILLGIALLGVAYLVFRKHRTGISGDPAFIYAPLPFLLWAAVRFGATGAISAIFATALISISGAAHGLGPFVTRSHETNVLSLQIFLSVSSVLLLLLCAVMSDLKQARERLARAFGSSPDAMLIMRKSDGHILEWNERAEKLFAYLRRDAVGRTVAELNIYLDEADYRRLLADTSSGSSVHDLEVLFRNRNGEIRRTLLSADTDEIDGASCLILSLHDVTERRRLEEETRQLSSRLVNAKEEERKRIARELHDDLTQRLALLAVEVDLLNEEAKRSEVPDSDRLEAIGSQLRELTSDVDLFSHHLHPAQLEQRGLIAAARAYCLEIETRWSIPVRFRERGNMPSDLDPAVVLCLYRVLQEALQNAARHSDTFEIHVQLKGEKDQLRLVVIDKGKGFNVESPRDGTGLGLVSMCERVKQLYGSIDIQSKPGEGTRVEVTVPLLHQAPL
jgi:PAS domain S-box-containing protein